MLYVNFDAQTRLINLETILNRVQRIVQGTDDDRGMRVLQALIRRKVKVADPDAIYRIMVPLPLPLSWGRSVRPYVPR